jgi:hypothetical protein
LRQGGNCLAARIQRTYAFYPAGPAVRRSRALSATICKPTKPAPIEGSRTYQESESGEETMKVILPIILFFMPVFMAQNDDEQQTVQLVRDTKVIVVAEVIEVGEAPGIWSGYIASVQRVKYEVKEVLKGDLAQRRVCGGHYVVHNSSTADKTFPRLAQTIFAKGNRFVLLLEPDPHPGKGYFETPRRTPMCNADEPSFLVKYVDYGVMPAEEKTLKSIRQAISSK